MRFIRINVRNRHRNRRPGRTAGWILLAVCFIAAMISGAAAQAENGTWGNLEWTLDGNGLLIISGSGWMNDFSSTSTQAWHQAGIPDRIKKVVIQEGIQTIGKWAFYNCANLTEITIPASVGLIDEAAFHSCGSLGTVSIPIGMTQIYQLTFRYCTSLSEIELPAGLTVISNNAFEGCSSLKELEIPSGVRSIGHDAFFGCSSLTGIVLPGDLIGMGQRAFQGCSGLKTITVPGTLKTVEDQCFLNCTGLKEIILSDGVETVGKQAFSGCNGVENVIIPESVKTIDSNAFNGNAGLKSVIIPDSVTSLGGNAFYQCTGLKSAVLPGNIKTIGHGLFSSCSSLESIIIPQGVTSIADYAFRHCTGLKHVMIPDSVTEISFLAFEGCSGIHFHCVENSEALTILQGRGLTVYTRSSWNSEESNTGYTLYSDGTLVISGTGDLDHYTRENALWRDDWEVIQDIVVDPRITFHFPEGDTPSIWMGNDVTGNPEISMEKGGEIDLSEAFHSNASFVLDRDLRMTVADEEAAALDGKTLRAVNCGETTLTVYAAVCPDFCLSIPVRIEHQFEDGACIFCGEACMHRFDAASPGICAICGWVCPHAETVGEGGTPPTEEEAGRTPAAVCRVCGTVITEGRTIPKLGEMNWLTLPSDTKTIGEEAFRGGSFDAVLIPEGCESVGNLAFAQCPNLVYVIADTETEIAEDAFEGCGIPLVHRQP